MAKRFTDTDKYKKAFIRTLPAAYKLFWDYLYHDCDHAGIWHKDFEVAQIRIGLDAPINESEALRLFNQGEDRIKILGNSQKWLLLPFVPFQYGTLNPQNRLHASVLSALSKFEISNLPKVLPRTLQAPTEGAKDKDKDKDMVKDKVKEERGVGEETNLDAPTAADLVDLWNRTAHSNLPRVVLLTDARKRKAQSRLKDHPDKIFWDELMAKVNRSPLLSGLEGKWRCSFDWMLEPGNMVKILEGNYEPGLRR